MLSVTNLLNDQISGNEVLRYGHVDPGAKHGSPAHHDHGPDRKCRNGACKNQGCEKRALTTLDPFGGAPRPVVVWALTKACNLKCVHCYASANAKPAPGELSDEQGRALLDDLKSFNVPAVLFSGGEPLQRPGAIEMIAYARSIGLRCTLSSNGLLIDNTTADRLRDTGLQYIGISIDGRRERHDKLRGQQGAFDQTLEAIDRCVRRGIKVGVRFTVHALNQEDLESIFELCDQHDVSRLCVYHLAYAGRGGKMCRADLTHEQTRDVLDRIIRRVLSQRDTNRNLEILTVGNHTDGAYLIEKTRQIDPVRAQQIHTRLRGTGGNRSGQNIAAVDPVGGVHYDQFSWHYTCGSVKEQPFSTIWGRPRDPRLKVLQNRAKLLPQKCQDCRYLDVCNGNLRTRAEVSTGDWLGEDPSCYLTAAERATSR